MIYEDLQPKFVAQILVFSELFGLKCSKVTKEEQKCWDHSKCMGHTVLGRVKLQKIKCPHILCQDLIV